MGLAGAGRPALGVGPPMRSSRAMVTANSGHRSAAVRRRVAVRVAHAVHTWASATGRPQAVIAQVVVIGASPGSIIGGDVAEFGEHQSSHSARVGTLTAVAWP